MSRPKTMDLRIALSVPGKMLEAVDEWRRHVRDIPARSEAIRRLVGDGIASHYLRHRGDHLLKMMEDLHRDGRISEEEMDKARGTSEACLIEAARTAAEISGSADEPGISAEAWQREMKVSPDAGPYVTRINEKPAPTYPTKPPRKLGPKK